MKRQIKRIVQEVLGEMNRQDCNVPNITANQTFLTLDDVNGVGGQA